MIQDKRKSRRKSITPPLLRLAWNRSNGRSKPRPYLVSLALILRAIVVNDA